MKINRENYEEYFLDYSEGNLDADLYNDLLDFLNNNPELKSELREFQDNNFVIHAADNITFQGKTSLKKDPEAENINLIIASLEGDLDQEKQKVFLKKLENDLELKNEYLQYKNTKLRPDNSVRFPDKSSLKRTIFFGVSHKRFISYFSAAASVLIILSVYFISSEYFETEKRYYSERKSETKVFSETELSDQQDNSLSIVENKPEKIKSVSTKQDETEKKSIPEGSKTKLKSKPVKLNIDSVKKNQNDIPVLRDSTNLNLKKINSNAGKLQGEKIKKQTKPILKPVEIQSQGLLADASDTKHDEYLTVKEYLGKSFKERVLKDKPLLSYNLNAWDIADAGLIGINKLTGSEMGISRKYNEDGEIIAYSFVSNKFSVEKGNIKGQ